MDVKTSVKIELMVRRFRWFDGLRRNAREEKMIAPTMKVKAEIQGS